MAQRHLDPTNPLAGPVPTGDALAGHLRAQATEFLRALRSANASEGSTDATHALRRSARRISAALHTFQPLLDPAWSESLRPELAWLSGTLAMEQSCTARLDRLLTALQRLSATDPATPGANLTLGTAKAGALLDRRLTLARARAHSTALQALGSSRFHALADKVAVLASEVPLTKTAADTDLRPLATAAQDRLCDAVATLPLPAPDTAPHPQDAPWHQVRLLLRLHRYAREAISGPKGNAVVDLPLLAASRALDRHRDASEAAAAAAQAAHTPRIAPATAYVLGVLHADQRHEVEAARHAFQQCWQKVTAR
ncbi:CHAD domain-containing protein [Streptomyces sp. NPDC007929]|uniref:CHAD domain-containing protein n=1 Tax=unclassified Streptomyces TaxID=2593676 RepID=UPI0036EC99FE